MRDLRVMRLTHADGMLGTGSLTAEKLAKGQDIGESRAQQACSSSSNPEDEYDKLFLDDDIYFMVITIGHHISPWSLAVGTG